MTFFISIELFYFSDFLNGFSDDFKGASVRGRKNFYTTRKDTIPNRAKKLIEKTAQNILNVRAKYPDSSLADLYDETLMPSDLRKAHQDNDKAVMSASGWNWKGMAEEDCVVKLMKLYQAKYEES